MKKDPLIKQQLVRDWHDRIQDVVFYTRATCRSLGYALAIHGSLRRDVDAIAVPWTKRAVEREVLVKAVYDTLMRLELAVGWCSPGEAGEAKPHGRHAWGIALKGEPFMYLDLSVLPWSSG